MHIHTATMDLDGSEMSAEEDVGVIRFLQSDIESNRGRTVLTVLYLCVLSLCFIVPVYFYCKMHCDDRSNQRLRELEIATITQAMTESQAVNREETRAQRRKYREERRARIIQLFAPVRMILKEEHFLDTKPTDENLNNSAHSNTDIEAAGTDRIETKNDDDEEDTFILVPEPGLSKGAFLEIGGGSDDSDNNKQSTPDTIETMRQVPNECSICLCEYTVGSDIVWSSNPQCDHVFHEECIEQWLMKQREGPLCPCCRRDFVIDPFDDIEVVGEISLSLDDNRTGGSPGGIPAIDGTMQTIESQDDASDQSENQGEQEA
ncbi:MAG: hypothetical protein SGILL_010772 [Bacillariaceae sp.]